MADEQTVVTPEATAAYAFVHEPRKGLNVGDEPQYSITLLFDKKTDITTLKNAARAAAKQKFGEKMPPGLKSPFRDGDMERPDDETFAGKTFITAKSKTKPGMVDQRVQPILDPLDFYSGVICRASVYAYGYDVNGNKGVSFLINNLQKLRDGTRVSGRRPAEEDFGPVGGSDPAGAAVDELDDNIPF